MKTVSNGKMKIINGFPIATVLATLGCTFFTGCFSTDIGNPVGNETPDALSFDLNQDGKIGIRDFGFALSCTKYMGEILGDPCPRANFDRDEFVTKKDAEMIIPHLQPEAVTLANYDQCKDHGCKLGDSDGDGHVDTQDFLFFRECFGYVTTSSPEDYPEDRYRAECIGADIDNDGTIGSPDLVYLKENLEQYVPSGIYGEVDGNGVINLDDYVLARKCNLVWQYHMDQIHDQAAKRTAKGKDKLLASASLAAWEFLVQDSPHCRAADLDGDKDIEADDLEGILAEIP